MLTVVRSKVFHTWLSGLRDRSARATIARRLDRVAEGHLGDAKSVGESVSELRVHVGPGYRVYFMRQGKAVIVLLCGGDKGSQERDIRAAKRLAKEWTDDDAHQED